MSNEYISKHYDKKHETKRSRTFEQGRECGDTYDFHKQLRQAQMTWKEFPSYGLIVHQPSGMTMHMGLTLTTTARHKCYTLNKLKERVRNTGTWTLTPKDKE